MTNGAAVMSWVWLDGVTSFEKARRVRAWKKWEGRFPTAYLVEMIAQAGAILLGAESDYQNDIVFIKIEKVEFSARPGDGKRIEIEAEPDGLHPEGGWFQGRIFQEGNPIGEGRVLLMNVGRLRADGKGPVTFPPQLLEAVSNGRKVT